MLPLLNMLAAATTLQKLDFAGTCCGVRTLAPLKRTLSLAPKLASLNTDGILLADFAALTGHRLRSLELITTTVREH